VGNPPFEAEGHKETYRRITKVDLKFPKTVSKLAQDLIIKLLQKQPKDRVPLAKALYHPFITQFTQPSPGSVPLSIPSALPVAAVPTLSAAVTTAVPAVASGGVPPSVLPSSGGVYYAVPPDLLVGPGRK